VFHISDKLNREVGIFLVLVVCTFSIKKSLRNISCHYLLATTKSNNYSYSLGCFQSMNPCQTPVIRPLKGKVNPQIAKSLLLSRCELASWGQINPCERASRPAEKQSKSLSARSPAPTPSDPGIFSTSGGVAPRALPRPRALPQLNQVRPAVYPTLKSHRLGKISCRPHSQPYNSFQIRS
jgi:hypothetical protein